MLRKLKHVGKKASRYKFTATLHQLNVHGTKSWQPFKLAIVCTRRKKRLSGKAQSWRPSIENPYKGTVNWAAHNQESLEINITFFQNQHENGFMPKDWVFVLENEAQSGKRKAIATTRLDMAQYITDVPTVQQMDLPLKPLTNKLKSANLQFSLTCVFMSEGVATDYDLASMAGSTTSEDTIGLGNIDVADVRDLDDTDIDGSSRGSTLGGNSISNSSFAQSELHELTQKIELLSQSNADPSNFSPSSNLINNTEGLNLKPISRHASTSSGQSEHTSVSQDSSLQNKRLEQLDENEVTTTSAVGQEKRQSCSSDAASSHASTPKQKRRLRPSVDFLPHSQVEPAESLNSTNNSPATENQKSILKWCQRVTENHRGVKVTNFTTSWRNGLALCAIVHHYRPDLVDYDTLVSFDGKQNIRKAVDGFNSMCLSGIEDVTPMYLSDKNNLIAFLTQIRNCLEQKKLPSKVPDPKATSSSPAVILHKTQTNTGLYESARVKLLSDLEEKEDEDDVFSAALDDALEENSDGFSEQFSPGPFGERATPKETSVKTFRYENKSVFLPEVSSAIPVVEPHTVNAELPIDIVLKSLQVKTEKTEDGIVDATASDKSDIENAPVDLSQPDIKETITTEPDDKTESNLNCGSHADESEKLQEIATLVQGNGDDTSIKSDDNASVKNVDDIDLSLPVEINLHDNKVQSAKSNVSPINKHSLSKDSAIECGSDTSFYETHSESLEIIVAKSHDKETALPSTVLKLANDDDNLKEEAMISSNFDQQKIDNKLNLFETKFEAKPKQAEVESEKQELVSDDPLRETVDKLLKSSAARNKKAKTLELIEKAKSQVNVNSKREVSERAQRLIDEARATLGRSSSPPKYPEEMQLNESCDSNATSPTLRSTAPSVSDQSSVEGTSTKRQASDGHLDETKSQSSTTSESDSVVNFRDNSRFSTSKSDNSSGFESSQHRDSTDDSLCEKTVSHNADVFIGETSTTTSVAKEPCRTRPESPTIKTVATSSSNESSTRVLLSEPLNEPHIPHISSEQVVFPAVDDLSTSSETLRVPPSDPLLSASAEAVTGNEHRGNGSTILSTESQVNEPQPVENYTNGVQQLDDNSTISPLPQVERRKKTAATSLVDRLSVASTSELHKRLSTALQKKSISENPTLDVVSELEKERISLEKEHKVVEERSIEVQMELQELKNINNRGNKQREGQLMQEWFQLVHKKNAILRQQDQLSLMEEEQEILEKVDKIHEELIPLMEIEDVMKTLAQKEREKVLLDEKFRLVNERDRIMQDMNEKEQMALEEEERLQTSLGENMSKVIKDDEKCVVM
uniref:EH domain-binding protein 1-like n=1 Tax=Phallusia mammillata TaxID=59560 RepID=A0A6F9DB40_9ASCI|nr:EH domain-binding protein 1-like [Phallusia mammillata]